MQYTMLIKKSMNIMYIGPYQLSNNLIVAPNIVYSVLIIAIIGGLVGGYKWINSLNSSTEKAVGIKN